jgi:hypothetical protein
LRFAAGSAPVSSPEDVVAALRLRPGVAFSASVIPCFVSAGGLLPVVSGGVGRTSAGVGDGIVISLVPRGEVCCCAGWSFEGVAGELGREEEFFGDIGAIRCV